MYARTIQMAAVSIAIFVTGVASAQTLCDRPLRADCVVPQWGQIDPGNDAGSSPSGRTDGTENGMAASRLPAADAGQIRGGAHIRLAQMLKPMNVPHPPQLLIDSGERFERETRALVRAIKSATFDRDGNIKSGERAISTAAEALRVPSKNNQLNLYIKVPTKLNSNKREVLMAKVHSINEIIEQAISDSGYQKKNPNG